MKPLDLQAKKPKQERSRGLVEAIFEATVRILPLTGSRNITTRKIAEIAGVSIGSLYQYFPNKEALLASLIDISIGAINRETMQMIERLDSMSLDEAIDHVVDFRLEKLMTEKVRIREIFLQAPELGRLPALFDQRQKVVEKLASILELYRPGFTREKYVRVAYTAVNGCVGVIHTTLYDETQVYEKAELAPELRSLARAYIHAELGEVRV